MFRYADISLITFDLDDTLWPCAPVIEAAELQLLTWLESRTPRIAAQHDILSLREHRSRTKAAYPEFAHDVSAVRLASLRQLMQDHGYSRDLADEAFTSFLRVRNRVVPYPEVAGVLRRLAARFTLVATTNGNADVRQTALSEYFHFSVTAAEAGAAKPAPNMFLGALAWAGASAERALHVGDDPALDVDAARRLGMKTAWINRSGSLWPDTLERAEVELRDLCGLLSCFGIDC